MWPLGPTCPYPKTERSVLPSACTSRSQTQPFHQVSGELRGIFLPLYACVRCWQPHFCGQLRGDDVPMEMARCL